MSISRVSFIARGGDGGDGIGGGVGERALSTPEMLSAKNKNAQRSELTVIDVSVMRNDLLDDGRPDFWL
jgi:hypothetical protein